MLTYVHNFINSLVSSAIVESITVVLLLYLLQLSKVASRLNLTATSNQTSRFKLVIVASVGTMLTIPYVWFVFPTLLWDKAGYTVITGESFAFIVEALFYRYFARLDWKYAFLFSFIANIMSYVLGKI